MESLCKKCRKSVSDRVGSLLPIFSLHLQCKSFFSVLASCSNRISFFRCTLFLFLFLGILCLFLAQSLPPRLQNAFCCISLTFFCSLTDNVLVRERINRRKQQTHDVNWKRMKYAIIMAMDTCELHNH